METLPTDLEGQVEYIVRKMQESDQASGQAPMSDAAQQVLRGNIYTSFKEGRSHLFTKQYGLPEIQVEQDLNFSNAQAKPDFSKPMVAPHPMVPSVSFAELASPYYGQNFDKELNSAFAYNAQNPPPSTFPGQSFKNFTPAQVDGGVPVSQHPTRSGYDATSDTINVRSNYQPAELESAIGQATYGNKINRDSSNFSDPNELLVALGQAQRQHYKAAGSRLTPDTMGKLLEKGDFSIFDDQTTKALQYLDGQRKDSTPEGQKRYQDALMVLPGLVQNIPPSETAKQLFS